MKKTALILTIALAGMLAQSAWATSTISATPSTQMVTDNSTFQVTFSLAVTGTTGDPASVHGVDLFLQAVNSQNGVQRDFQSVRRYWPECCIRWLAAGPGAYPDPFQRDNRIHTADDAENTRNRPSTIAPAVTHHSTSHPIRDAYLAV